MPGMQEVPFGSLTSREYDERVPLEHALLCDDCWTDRDGIEGRSGYRRATAAAIGSGTSQAIARFRPSATAARTIVARGGRLYAVTDPSSETTSDGAVTEIICAPNPPFSDASRISLVQFGKYMYCGSDQTSEIWQRIKPDFTAEAFASITKPTAPTVTSTPLAYRLLSSLSAPALAGGATAVAASVTDWLKCDGAINATITYDLGADVDASAIKWLFVAGSPSTVGGGGGLFRIEVATAAGSFEALTDITDTAGNDAPYAVYASMLGLTTPTRTALRRIRFTQVGNPATNSFWISGFMFAPTAPGPGEVIYYITYYNPTTGQESALSDPIKVTYGSEGVTFPNFNAGRSSGNSFIGIGSRSTNPDTFDASSLYNKGAGKETPPASQFSPLRTFTNASVMPPGNYTQVRLWRTTPTGVRLVKTVPATPGAAPGAGYSVTDDTGDATLSHQSYVAGGSPSPCLGMAAVGGRLISGGDPATPPRINISSFLAFGLTTDPFPQFPPIPVTTADGHAFDIAPTSAEQVLWLGEGDLSLFIGTNENMYLLSDLTPNLSPPYAVPNKIWVRGVIGRQAALYVERTLFWCAHDGVYSAANRLQVEEMSKEVRDLYRNWFAPDSSTVAAYKDRKLLLVKGQLMLRYDFVTGRWSRHNLAHSMMDAAIWRDPFGVIQQCWFLSTTGQCYRWQPGTGVGDPNRALSDDGTAIPAWVYRTGYAAGAAKMRVKGVLLDRTGALTLAVYKDASQNQTLAWTGSTESQQQFTPTITSYKLSVRLTGANTVSVKRLFMQIIPTDGEGQD